MLQYDGAMIKYRENNMSEKQTQLIIPFQIIGKKKGGFLALSWAIPEVEGY